MQSMCWSGLGFGVAFSAMMAVPLLAQDALAVPQGEVILTVTGGIAARNAGDAAELDLAMLEAMGSVKIETHTIWSDGPQVFEGVPLATLLERLGAEGTVIAASALNDYTVEIPMADAVAEGPIVAYRQNGAVLSVRDKGPLWVVYPYDSDPAYQTEVIYARSIWQLARIEVR
ncbi:MAG: hypothetical protein RL216_1306 [Pseudomonadota bacterium]